MGLTESSPTEEVAKIKTNECENRTRVDLTVEILRKEYSIELGTVKVMSEMVRNGRNSPKRNKPKGEVGRRVTLRS